MMFRYKPSICACPDIAAALRGLRGLRCVLGACVLGACAAGCVLWHCEAAALNIPELTCRTKKYKPFVLAQHKLAPSLLCV